MNLAPIFVDRLIPNIQWMQFHTQAPVAEFLIVNVELTDMLDNRPDGNTLGSGATHKRVVHIDINNKRWFHEMP